MIYIYTIFMNDIYVCVYRHYILSFAARRIITLMHTMDITVNPYS